MKSTWGRRGIVLEKFGWTWEYLNWKVPYVVIQRVMADMPWFEYEKTDTKGKKKKGSNLKLTPDNVDAVIASFNSLPR